MEWRRLVKAASCFIIVASYVLWDERLRCYDGCVVPEFYEIKFPRRPAGKVAVGQFPRGEPLEHFRELGRHLESNLHKRTPKQITFVSVIRKTSRI
jgi:hypothetical protein